MMICTRKAYEATHLPLEELLVVMHKLPSVKMVMLSTKPRSLLVLLKLMTFIQQVAVGISISPLKNPMVENNIRSFPLLHYLFYSERAIYFIVSLAVNIVLMIPILRIQ